MGQNLVSVNQSNVTAGGDVVGGNKTVVYAAPSAPLTVVEKLLAKLQQEVESSAQTRAMIDALLYFHERKSHDGVVGLEEKLKVGGRVDETSVALEKKELFAKALDKWSMYASAQEIFVYLLAKAEHEFTYHVLPKVGQLDQCELNEVITARIVDPIVQECGASVFHINHATAMGMFYWLAEQCFVRWHK